MPHIIYCIRVGYTVPQRTISTILVTDGDARDNDLNEMNQMVLYMIMKSLHRYSQRSIGGLYTLIL